MDLKKNDRYDMEAGLPLDESYLECDLPEILADLIGKHEEVMGD